jgi:hypothetical protein
MTVRLSVSSSLSTGVTPLCHFVTSPPQGGRLLAVWLSQSKQPRNELQMRERPSALPISPLEREMSARPTEGGIPAAQIKGAKQETESRLSSPSRTMRRTGGPC